MQSHAGNAFWAEAVRIIEGVAHDRMIQVFHMDTDLVRPSGFRIHLKRSEFMGGNRKSFQHFVLSYRFAPFAPHSSPGEIPAEVFRASANGLIDKATVVSHPAVNYGNICFLYFPIYKLAF